MDREKVIKALECRKNAEMRCGNPCEEYGNCEYATLIRDPSGEPYYPYICDRKKLCEDAISLLKEQEAVEPINNYGTLRCGKCKNIVGYNDGHSRGYLNSFCSKCGKAVKRNDIAENI